METYIFLMGLAACAEIVVTINTAFSLDQKALHIQSLLVYSAEVQRLKLSRIHGRDTGSGIRLTREADVLNGSSCTFTKTRIADSFASTSETKLQICKSVLELELRLSVILSSDLLGYCSAASTTLIYVCWNVIMLGMQLLGAP